MRLFRYKNLFFCLQNYQNDSNVTSVTPECFINLIKTLAKCKQKHWATMPFQWDSSLVTLNKLSIHFDSCLNCNYHTVISSFTGTSTLLVSRIIRQQWLNTQQCQQVSENVETLADPENVDNSNRDYENP